MFSASEMALPIRNGRPRPAGTFPCEALKAGGPAIVAPESLLLIGVPLRPAPAVCAFSAPKKCQTIRDGTGDV